MWEYFTKGKEDEGEHNCFFGDGLFYLPNRILYQEYCNKLKVDFRQYDLGHGCQMVKHTHIFENAPNDLKIPFTIEAHFNYGGTISHQILFFEDYKIAKLLFDTIEKAKSLNKTPELKSDDQKELAVSKDGKYWLSISNSLSTYQSSMHLQKSSGGELTLRYSYAFK